MPTITSLLRRMFRVHWLPSAFLVVVALASFGLGLTFLAVPDLYLLADSFAPTFTLMDSWLWSLLLIVPATWITVAVALERRQAMWPCQVLALVFVLFGLSTVPAVIGGTGVPSASIVYSAVGILTSLSGVLAYVWDEHQRTVQASA